MPFSQRTLLFIIKNNIMLLIYKKCECKSFLYHSAGAEACAAGHLHRKRVPAWPGHAVGDPNDSRGAGGDCDAPQSGVPFECLAGPLPPPAAAPHYKHVGGASLDGPPGEDCVVGKERLCV